MAMGFYTDLERGKIGEQLVYNALAAKNHKVIDLRNDIEARWNDIDCVVEKNGLQTTLEIKTDFASERTGNFFIEYQNYNNIKHKYLGWFKYCKAEWICFVQETARKAYIVSFDELKETIEKNKFRTACGIDASGFLLPFSALEQFESLFCLEL